MRFKMDVADSETGEEVEIVVEAEVTRFYPGRYSGPPEDCYPSEGGEIEELIVYLNDKDITDQVSTLFGPGTMEEIKDVTHERARILQESY